MSVKLTEAQLVIMSSAAQRKDRCLSAPTTIKGAALIKVSAKLAKLGLVREIEAKPTFLASFHLATRRAARRGGLVVLRAEIAFSLSRSAGVGPCARSRHIGLRRRG